MDSYDTQQVCLSGHQITDSYHHYPQHRKKRCPECGSETIHQCRECQSEIRGKYRVTGVLVTRTTPVPTYCEECGEPFPWTATNDVARPEPPWMHLHPSIAEVARPRFEGDQYADAVEAALKAVNARVKTRWRSLGNEERDGKPLMLSAFSANHPAIVLADLSTESGRNEQEGYMHLFAGALQGIRNPKAHDNLQIVPTRAIHHLHLASLLMFKLDDAGVPS